MSSETRSETLTSKALLVKSTLLFERGRAFSRMSGTGKDFRLSPLPTPTDPVNILEFPSNQRAEFEDSFRHFRNLAMTFKSSLPQFETWLRNPNVDIVRTVYVGVTLLDAALIRFHGVAASQGDERARQLCVISAQEIFNNSIGLAASSWNFGFLNPIIGVSAVQEYAVLLYE